MSDRETLLVVLIVIYLAECSFWLRRGSVAFAKYCGKISRLLHPGALLANQRGGLLLSNPLPPLTATFLCPQWPVSLSPKGIFSYVAQTLNPGVRPTQPATWFSFEEIQKVAAADKNVLVNGVVFVRTTSPGFANYLAKTLENLRTLPETKRAPAIRQVVRESLDIKQAARRLAEFTQQSRWLRVQCNLLFVLLFVVAPVVVWYAGLRRTWLGLVIGLLAITVPTAIEFFQRHKTLYPAERSERNSKLFAMCLAPVMAIRAPDVLGRHLLERFHPAAAARLLLPEKVFAEFARDVLLDLRHPLLPVCPTSEPLLTDTERWYRTVLLEEFGAFLQREGFNLQELTGPPEPNEPASRSYCPRCRSQFAVSAGNCRDCGGILLVPFKAKPEAPERSVQEPA